MINGSERIFLHCHFSQDLLSYQNNIRGSFLLRPLQLVPAFCSLPWLTADLVYWSLCSLLSCPPTLTPWRLSSGKKNGHEISHSSLCNQGPSAQDSVTPKASMSHWFFFFCHLFPSNLWPKWPVQASQSIFISGWTLLLWIKLCTIKMSMLKYFLFCSTSEYGCIWRKDI